MTVLFNDKHFIMARHYIVLSLNSVSSVLYTWYKVLSLIAYHIQQIETHYVSYYGWGLTPISKFKVNCLTYIIAQIRLYGVVIYKGRDRT